MSYLILSIYFISFFLTIRLQNKRNRFFIQLVLVAVITIVDAYVFYQNMLIEAVAINADWDWPGPISAYEEDTKVDLVNFTIYEHFLTHHYVYCFVVFFMMLTFFHFGSKIVDHLIKTYPSRKYDK